MNKKTITVSLLPNISFYSGEYAEEAASALENRQYGTEISYFGELSLTRDNNSYWSYMPSNIFGENPINYSNIGDIITSTIAYMGKFKNNKVDIQVDKNILTFNYRYEEDLAAEFKNTYIVPAQKLVDLLLNVNDMRFNKLKYYKDNIELKRITYAHKKYPYNPDGTHYTVTEDNNIVEYDFSNQFVDYNYIETSYDVSYTGYIMREIIRADGTIGYIPTDISYTGFNTYYSYSIYDINPFDNRMYSFFENNSNKIEEEYGDLKTYFISELDTVLTLNLNTYSLGGKNLYAYFNFTSNYNNWFNNIISFDVKTEELNENETLAKIEPLNNNYFNVCINTDKVCGNDVKSNNIITFKINDLENLNDIQKFDIVNPSNIKGIDLTSITDKLKKVNFINNYNKKLNVYETINTNWIIEDQVNIEYLRIGTVFTQSSIEELYGISNITSLKEIDILNCNKLKKDFSISKMPNLEKFNAAGSNIKNFIPRKNSHFTYISLPSTINTLTLNNVEIDEFKYNINTNLINLSLYNVTGEGINIQSFVKAWINALDNTQAEGKDISILKDGIITNTNLVGINFENYKVNDLLKFKYIGLNKFSGNISIVGENTTNLNRKEYLQLRNVFGDEIMETGEYTENTQPIKFQYTLDPQAFYKKAYFYYKTKINANGELIDYILPEFDDLGEIKEFNFIMNDNIGGQSLLDYFDSVDMIQFTKNKGKFGYEVELPNKIFTDNDNANSLTKTIVAGDVVIYKGNKLILVINTPQNNVYNYVKVGRFIFSHNASDEITIAFKKLNIVNGEIRQ